MSSATKAMTDDAGRRIVRVHSCWACNHTWEAQVVLADYATNLSGEVNSYCPKCGKKSDVASSAHSETGVAP